MLEIIPAILTQSRLEVQSKLDRLKGIVKRVQIDIIDGKFVNNKTIEPDVLGLIENDFLIDFHLMTKEPGDWIESCIRGMADRIIGQVEMMSNQVDFVRNVHANGISVGLAIDINTLVDAIDPFIFTDIDVILVMSVKAGFSGQKFDDRVLKKIRYLNKIRKENNTNFKICVDGGINESNISSVRREGVDEVVVGGHLFKEELTTYLEKLKRYAYQ